MLLCMTMSQLKIHRIQGSLPFKVFLKPFSGFYAALNNVCAGTNTYLIGQTNPYILLDAGQGIPSYIPLLREALAKPANPLAPEIADIILTHRHHDHTRGLPSVLTLLRDLWSERNPDTPFAPPRIHKHSIPIDATPDEVLDEIVSSLDAGTYSPAPDGQAFHPLEDGQIITVPSSAEDDPLQLKVLYTPGHTTDSISLLFNSDRALFTGDTILGKGTAVFEDLALYMSSLRKMLFAARTPADGGEEGGGYAILYPAHGPVVENGPTTIKMYIEHRLEREGQIIEVLSSKSSEAEVKGEAEGGDQSGVWTTWGIVMKMYSKFPESLWEPAAHGVNLHLMKLEKDGKVKVVGGEGKETQWVLI